MIVGIDAHAETCKICEMDANGEVIKRYNIPTNYIGFKHLLRSIPKSSEIVLESSTVSKPIYRHLQNNGMDVHMANPRGVKAISPTSKTDEKDAEMLAHLLRTDLLPESYVPSPEEDEMRTVTRFRLELGQKSAEIKNQIHAILKSNLIGYERSDLFGKAGMEYLQRIILPRAYKLALDSYLRQFGQLKAEIEKIDHEMASLASANPAAKLLMTIPGIDYYSALIIVSEIGNVNRFPDARHLSAYAGLVPKVHVSGNIERTGRITKAGPAHLRRILILNAHSAVKREGKLRRFYLRLAKKKGSQKAIVATAHKMLIVIYHMLTKNQSYEERNDELFERKISKLEFKAKFVMNSAAEKTAMDTTLMAAGVESITNDPEIIENTGNDCQLPRSRLRSTPRSLLNNKEDSIHSRTHKKIKRRSDI